MFRSATFKLTVWYLTIVVVICLAFSAAVYHFATRELAHTLSTQTQRIYTNFPVFDNDPFWRRDTDLAIGSQRILKELIEFNIVVFIAAGFASYWLARRTLEPIELAHEQQKRFTADVSHELRTPLTALKMESEVALMSADTSKQELRAVLESNLEEAAKMDTLINNLLRLTKLDTNQVQTNFRKLSLNDVIAEAISHVEKQAGRKHATINNQVKKLALSGDYDSLVQLVVILLDNAIKYSPENSTITLDSSKLDSTVRLTVQDQGQGISPEALPHVFERFYRADKARTSSTTNGYGLGLSIAKLIADVHHGTITISSRVGKGTTVTVLLPVQLQS